MTDKQPADKPRKVSPPKVIREATKVPRKKAPPRKTHTKAGPPLEVRVAVADRRAKAYAMKLAGANDVDIGRALTRQGHQGRAPIPHGYDGDMEDAALAAVVRSDLVRAMQDRYSDIHAKVASHREIMVERHYRALAMLWPSMLTGNTKAHMAALGHMRAIAKLAGLDEPTRLAIGSDDPDVIAAYGKIMAVLAEKAAEQAGVDAADMQTRGEG